MVSAEQEPQAELQTVRHHADLSTLEAVLFAAFYPLHKVDTPIPGVTVGEILLLVCCVLAFIHTDMRQFRMHGILFGMVLLYASFALLTLLVILMGQAASLRDVAVRLIRWGFYVLCAALLGQSLPFPKAEKWIKTFAVLSSALVLIQWLAYRGAGYVLSFPTGGASYETYPGGGVWRFSGIFKEPAQFAYFASLGGMLFLFYREELAFRPLEVGCILLIFLAMFACSSTYGLALAALVAGWFLLACARRLAPKRGVLFLTSLGLIGLLLLICIVRGQRISGYLVYKLGAMRSRERALFVWTWLPEQGRAAQFLGVGVGNEEFYFEHQLHQNVPYLNSLSMTYLYGGWTGLALVGTYWLAALLSQRRDNPILLVAFALICLYSVGFYSTVMVLFTAVYASGRSCPCWCGRRRH